jgi:large subunit ribosomal protein L21
MDYVIAQVSGRQFLLKKNNWYDFDYIKNLENNTNQIIYLNKILLFKKQILKTKNLQIGSPFLTNLKIPLKFIQNLKKNKLLVLKTKPKKKYTRLKGHRQLITRLQFI